MTKIISENVKSIFLVLLWTLLLFTQHIICFDFFDSNFLYLYVLAILCALVQYAFLRYVNNKRYARVILKICCVVYICVAILKALEEIYFLRFEPRIKGLNALCLLLDVVGAIFALLELRSKTKKTRDGFA